VPHTHDRNNAKCKQNETAVVSQRVVPQKGASIAGRVPTTHSCQPALDDKVHFNATSTQMAETEGVMIAEKVLGVSIPHSRLDAQQEQAATAGDLGTNAAARAEKRAEAGPHLEPTMRLKT
jgi:hypothetical protein